MRQPVGRQLRLRSVPPSTLSLLGLVRHLAHVERSCVEAAAPAQSFYVIGTEGPLVAGELERAREWGESLAASFPVAAA